MKPKAIDTVKKWIKEYCIKGQPLDIYSSPNLLLIIKKPSYDYKFSYTMVKKPRKKKGI